MPYVAAGKEVVVIESAGAVTVIDSAWAADAGVASASVTSAVKPKVPVQDGFPVIAPVLELRVSPACSAPDSIDHEYGLVPPVAASWPL